MTETDNITVQNVRKITKLTSDGDIETEEVKPQRKKPKPPPLSPSQIRNMSHQEIKRYLQKYDNNSE